MKFAAPWRRPLALLEDIAARLCKVESHVSELAWRTAPTPPPPEPPPFVAVLVTGKWGAVAGPGQLGWSGYCGAQTRIELQTDVALTDCELIVFADLSRVHVLQMLLGNDGLLFGGRSCPIARFSSWDVGRKLTIWIDRLSH